MNRLIHFGSVENIPYYNCSGKSLEYWYSTGQKRPLFGWPLLVFGTFIEMIYFPLIYFIFKTKLVRFPCYQIIVFLGFIDALATDAFIISVKTSFNKKINTIVIATLISGYLFIMGAVFCTNQTLIYISGALGISCWCVACASTLFLVMNRVGDVLFPDLAHNIFEGKWIFIGFFIILLYGCFVFLFTPPILFNSSIMAWTTNPLVYEAEYQTVETTLYYRNYVQITNNWVLVFSSTSLYVLYCLLINKMRRGQKSNASRQVFIQAAIICIFNTSTALTYNALIYFPLPAWIVAVGEVCWTLVHGCPALIYITMNKTLRSEFSKFLTNKKNNNRLENSTVLRLSTSKI